MTNRTGPYLFLGRGRESFPAAVTRCMTVMTTAVTRLGCAHFSLPPMLSVVSRVLRSTMQHLGTLADSLNSLTSTLGAISFYAAKYRNGACTRSTAQHTARGAPITLHGHALSYIAVWVYEQYTYTYHNIHVHAYALLINASNVKFHQFLPSLPAEITSVLHLDNRTFMALKACILTLL